MQIVCIDFQGTLYKWVQDHGWWLHHLLEESM